jgi:cyclopropane fatty-acyl-phospholipid synthase-like methyltransferase
MLTDFVKADEELINPEPFANKIYEEILADKFFTQSMEEQFDNDYVELYSYWEDTISQEITQAIKDAIINKE